jgi:hypothetical protein
MDVFPAVWGMCLEKDGYVAVNSVFNHWKNGHTVLQSSCSIFPSHQQGTKVLVSAHLHHNT